MKTAIIYTCVYIYLYMYIFDLSTKDLPSASPQQAVEFD